MSLEGTNGKNPRYYSGFIYATLSKRLAETLHEKFEREVVAEIVSQNGGDLFDPWKAIIKMDHESIDQDRIEQVVESSFENIHESTEDFLSGNVTNW